jgi:hypothetical protein
MEQILERNIFKSPFAKQLKEGGSSLNCCMAFALHRLIEVSGSDVMIIYHPSLTTRNIHYKCCQVKMIISRPEAISLEKNIQFADEVTTHHKC